MKPAAVAAIRRNRLDLTPFLLEFKLCIRAAWRPANHALLIIDNRK
ncbi:hypothetical protein C7S16_3804 [Burkholderia thailandensis]|uniref:Uncharacterized protein n=1 Tax=Burkholderia thailandensis TaxID=57975 RepID=A0AAW9CVQ6_BURTH|nr:hypothetical protein [Burkholderia thailandensis]MDW9254745.1 hypothetical protein [Burkholderia thailandensis]